MLLLLIFTDTVLLLDAEARVYLDQTGNGDSEEATDHDDNEEIDVSYGIFEPSGYHARQHHTECHESGADGVMCGFALALAEVEHIEHVGGEAKSVSELLDEDTGADNEKIGRLCDTEEYVNEVRDCNSPDHRP